MSEIEIKETHHLNGQLKSKSVLINGHLHNLSGPAYVEFYDNGLLYKEIYAINGKPYRKFGPSVIIYHQNKKLKIKTKTYVKGNNTLIYSYKIDGHLFCIKTIINGKLHDKYGPANIQFAKNGSVSKVEHY